MFLEKASWNCYYRLLANNHYTKDMAERGNALRQSTTGRNL